MGIKLGLQIWALREDFSERPRETLEEVRKMGYSGVELNLSRFNHSLDEYRNMLDSTGLLCYGLLVRPSDLNKENIADTITACKKLGTDNVIVGGVDLERVRTDPDAPRKFAEEMNAAYSVLMKEGIHSGYHSHDTDFTLRVGEQSFYEFLLDNTVDGFSMVLDTGNAVAGGGDPLSLIKKYAKRTRIIHAKGYSEELKYLTPIWESTYGLESVIEAAIKLAGAEYFDVEFGARGEYVPLERAKESYEWMIKTLEKINKQAN